jgi:hypothetical protein
MEAQQPQPQPPQPIYPQQVYPPRRWPWIVGGIVALLVAGFLVWFFVIRDTGPANEVHGPAGAPFTVTLPSGWKSLPPDQLSELPGNPVAVMQQTDGAGVVIINTQPPTSGSLDALAKQIEAKLKNNIPDYKPIGTSTLNLPSGQAVQISYARTKAGTADTLVIVPAGGRIYTLNSVIPGGDKASVKEAVDIIQSFNA